VGDDYLALAERSLRLGNAKAAGPAGERCPIAGPAGFAYEPEFQEITGRLAWMRSGPNAGTQGGTT